MSNIFSGVSNFPRTDNWPSLSDKGQSSDPEFTILYAEHHNKLRDFILKSENVLMQGAAAGDGTLKGLTFMFNMTVSIPTILKAFAFNSYQDPTISVPGNVLPFEFIFTENVFSNNYTDWTTGYGTGLGRTGEPMIVRGIDQCSAVVQGLDLFSGKHFVTACIRPKDSLKNVTDITLGTGDTAYPWGSARLYTNTWVDSGVDPVGRKCLAVRGMIVNQNYSGFSTTSSDYLDVVSHLWTINCSHLSLSLRVMGAKIS